MRWFIIEFYAKNRECFPYPNVWRCTRTQPDFLGVDKTCPHHVVDLSTGLVFETQDHIGVFQAIHYALDVKLCVYGLLRKASNRLGSFRWT